MTAVTYSTMLFASALLFDICFWKINSNAVPVEIPPNATDIDGDVEHRMAYWREDLGLTRFHFHWHMYHPWTLDVPKSIINKDRRGELFYYFHQQFLARYNVERLCNGLDLVTSFSEFDEPIPGAYYPMLSSDVAGNEWSSRPTNAKLSNVYREDIENGLKFDVQDLKLHTKRILEDIDTRYVADANGTKIYIDNDQGIDILGNMVEAVRGLSPNFRYYGNLHNYGHVAIGHVRDSQNKYHIPPGVMLRPNTAVRDPLFYRWHAFLNDIFLKNKDTLLTYKEKILSFPEVQVTNVELCSQRNGKCRKEKNTLYTYMMKSDFNMSRGIDLFPRKPVLVRVTYQNHQEFHYTIKCINKSQRKLMGTVRIFIIPVSGFGNNTMKLSVQRHLAIEMDRFVQPLKPGRNRIVRKSTMSSVTIPFNQTFRDLDTNRPRDDEYDELDKFNSCGCGWPHHLLVPRGTAEGYPMLLFAMISDYSKDRVNLNEIETEKECKISILCSLRHEKYPYKLQGGYPFDRPIRNGVDTIESFLTPNMAIKPIAIFHSDKVRQGRVLSHVKSTILGKMTGT